MANINYIRGILNGTPYTINLWDDGTFLEVYGIRLKYSTNPNFSLQKPLKVGVDGYVETSLIDMVSDTLVSGTVDWNNQTIVNLAPASAGSNPVILDQLDYVSGYTAAVLAALEAKHDAEIDYVSGVLQGNINDLESKHDSEIDYVSGYFQTEITDLETKHDSEIDYVSGVLQSRIDAIETGGSADIDYVSGVLQNNIDNLELTHNQEIDYVSGVLQDQIDAITSDVPREVYTTVSGVAGETDFDFSPYTFSSNNSIYDIQVFINRGRIFQNRDFYKLDDHTIRTYVAVPQNSKVTIREERTGGSGGGGGGSTDLENITVDPQPDTDGNHSLGGTKAWSYVVLKDQVTGDHYQLSVSGGDIVAETV